MEWQSTYFFYYIFSINNFFSWWVYIEGIFGPTVGSTVFTENQAPKASARTPRIPNIDSDYFLVTAMPPKVRLQRISICSGHTSLTPCTLQLGGEKRSATVDSRSQSDHDIYVESNKKVLINFRLSSYAIFPRRHCGEF